MYIKSSFFKKKDGTSVILKWLKGKKKVAAFVGIKFEM